MVYTEFSMVVIELDKGPWERLFRPVPHYYGDIVRVLFVITAVLAMISIPIFGDLLPFGTFFEVAGIVLMILLAGITNPQGKAVLVWDALVAGAGALFLESAAISSYSPDLPMLFFARETTAVLLLFALYYSVKTIRAMAMHKIGHKDTFGEFVEADESDDDRGVHKNN